MKYLSLIVFFSSFLCSVVLAQNVRKIEILNSDSLVFDQKIGDGARRLYGNVAFKHDGTLMYCDSAYFYSIQNEFYAFSKVHIKHSDSLNIYGDSLHFIGNSKIAKMRGNVKLIDNNATLTTSFLDYDMQNNVAHYFNGGQIINSENILTSEIGKYFDKSKDAYFRDDVLLINPRYTIDTDTLRYNTTSKIAYFYGPTKIESDSNLLYTQNGWYNTDNETSEFYKHSYVNSGSKYIWGDTLRYERNAARAFAKMNVFMKDTIQNILLYGNDALFIEKPEYFYITDSVTMIKVFDKDSLYLSSDSIVYQKVIPNDIDSLAYNIIKSFNKVRFFKSDIQGKCDSLVYNFKDSIIELHTKPVLWTQSSQISGKEIMLRVAKDEIDRIFINNLGFIISEEYGDFNQIKGANMIGYIKDGELHKLEVIRNGETLYFMRDEEDLVGINKVECERIIVIFEKSEIIEINFQKKPQGTMYPPNDLSDEEKILQDFNWQNHIRPLHKNDIYIWRE